MMIDAKRDVDDLIAADWFARDDTASWRVEDSESPSVFNASRASRRGDVRDNPKSDQPSPA